MRAKCKNSFRKSDILINSGDEFEIIRIQDIDAIRGPVLPNGKTLYFRLEDPNFEVLNELIYVRDINLSVGDESMYNEFKNELIEDMPNSALKMIFPEY